MCFCLFVIKTYYLGNGYLEINRCGGTNMMDMYDFAKEVDGNMKFIALLIQFVDVPNISGKIRVFDESGTDLKIKVVDAAFSRKKKKRAGYR